MSRKLSEEKLREMKNETTRELVTQAHALGIVCPSAEKAEKWAAPIIEQVRRDYEQSDEPPPGGDFMPSEIETRTMRHGDQRRPGDGEMLVTGRRRGPQIPEGVRVDIRPYDPALDDKPAPRKQTAEEIAVRALIRDILRVPDLKERLDKIMLTLIGDQREAALIRLIDGVRKLAVGDRDIKNILRPVERKIIVNGR